MVGVDGVAPPELSQLIYSQPRYYLRYKLPLWWPRLRSNQLLQFFRLPLYHISYKTKLAEDIGFEPMHLTA